jgi:ABC-2 type transport system ATP-binding protein
MISIKQLSLWYKNVQALKEIELELAAGKFYGLVGPNGAGKSTLLRVMTGLISEYDGEVVIGQKNIREQRADLKKRIGYAPEDPDLLPYLTGKEFLHLVASLHRLDRREERIHKLIEALNLQDVQDELVHRYSHGMRQKISLAAALLPEAEIILLDEALNGLDPVSLFNVRNNLNQRVAGGATVILSSHILELLEDWTEEIIIMNEGRIHARHSRPEISEITQQKNISFSEYFIQLIGSRR